MKPEQFLKHTKRMVDSLKAMQRRAVFVGLPKDKVGGQIYGDGRSIIANGAVHEYGYGPIPQRSFLRVPFAIKRKELSEGVAKQFHAAVNGLISVDTGLGRVGALATNISKGAFTTQGYGTWDDIKQSTKDRKGSSRPLIDTGILRNSITSVIRNAS